MAMLSMIKRIMRLFSKTVESIQYNVDPAIAGDIRGTSKDKLFEELDLECLQYRRWYRNLCCFYKILKDQSLKYLFNVSSKLTRPRLQGTQIMFLISKLNRASSKILFSAGHH